jgi:ribonuclease HI
VETNNCKYFKSDQELTNNQAEYLAIREVLKELLEIDKHIVIHSDSELVINQLNHKFAINNDTLRELALDIWNMIDNNNAKVEFKWVSRKDNIAGKMLGS